MSNLAFRQAAESDLPFIIGSWCDSYRDAHAAGPIPMPEYDETMSKWLRNWYLKRPGVQVWVAYHPGEDSESRADIYAWCAVEHGVKLPRRIRVDGRFKTVLEEVTEPLVLYVYTKQPYRRLGVAKALLKRAGCDVSQPFLYGFKTGVVKDINLFKNGRWQPLVIRHLKE